MALELNEIKDSVAARLHERATSPFLSTFILSWLVINYDLVLLVLSGAPWDTKIQIIKSAFSGYLDYRMYYPFFSALFFVVIWPVIDILFYATSRKITLWRLSVKEIFDGEQRVTQEQFNKIYREQSGEITNLNNEVVSLSSELKETKEKNTELVQINKSVPTLQWDLNGALEQVKTSENLNIELKLKIGNLERELEAESLSKKELLTLMAQKDEVISELQGRVAQKEAGQVVAYAIPSEFKIRYLCTETNDIKTDIVKYSKLPEYAKPAIQRLSSFLHQNRSTTLDTGGIWDLIKPMSIIDEMHRLRTIDNLWAVSSSEVTVNPHEVVAEWARDFEIAQIEKLGLSVD